MSRTPVVLLAGLALAISIGSTSNAYAANGAWRSVTEPRLRAIYERREFWQTLQAEWLPDSSGYVIQERHPKTKRLVRVHHEVRTGKRIDVKDSNTPRSDSKHLLSPDGKYELESQPRKLFVRDLSTGQRTQLTESPAPAERDVFYREPRWSPDSKRIAFIESDMGCDLPSPEK